MQYVASRQLRFLYGLAIVSAVLPFGMSDWVEMTIGRPMLMIPYLGPIALLLVGIWRVYLVWRYPDTLNSYVYGRAMKVLRIIGLIGMAFAVVFLITRFLAPLLVRALVPSRSESGVEFYVVAVYLGLLGGVGPLGVLLFETSRLLGFELHRRTHPERLT